MRTAVGLGLFLALALVARAGDDAPAPPPAAQYDGKTAAEWTAALASDDVKVRQKAAYALFQLGKDAGGAAAALVKALRDGDAYVRTTSAKAIPRLPADAVKPVVPELAADLAAESQDVRREAGSVLWRLGPLAAEVVPELTKALASADEVVRAKAAWCLGNAGAAGKPALGALAKSADDPVEDVRKGAAHAIAIIDPGTAFASERTSVRLAALQAYGDWPKNKEWTDPVIVAGVVKSIDDGNEEIRAWAVHSLDTFAALSGDDRPVEWIAIFKRVLTTSRTPGARANAAYGLGRYKGRGPEVVPLLVEAAKCREPEVRTAAILALGWMAEEARSAVSLVAAALRDDDTSTRSAASHALGTLGDSSDAVIDGLAAVMSDGDRSVRYGAIVSLGALGKRSVRVASIFTKHLLDPASDPYDCAEIVRMLAFDGMVLEAKTQLTDAFEKDPKAPLSVAFALRALDAPSSEEAFARLTSALAGGTDPRKVLAYLRMLGPKAVPATAAVVPFLSNDDTGVRTTAAVALGAFGPGAQDALPALERASNDADATVALAAKQAIAQIRASPDRPK